MRTRKQRGLRLLTVPLGLAVVAASAAVLSAPASADAVYDRQPTSDTALFGVKGTNNAAAQEFVTAGDHLDKVSLYLSNRATTGTITAQVRTDREDAGSAVASRTLDIAELGGSGEGWLDFPLDADVRPDTRYYLFAQASTTENQPVAWHGTGRAAAGSLPSWNYDRNYWGGWHREDARRLAFFVNPKGEEGCGDPDLCYRAVPGSVLGAYTAGLLDNETTTAAITPVQAYGASYVPRSNVLKLPSGRWRYLPAGATQPATVPANDPGALRQIAESRAWLSHGTVPGRTSAQREASARALLSMRALLQPNGASVAAWYGIWTYSWPRDTSFVSAAFAHTGHPEEAYRILTYNASTQREDGTWEARTKPDGSGPPDGRHWQLDANGWVPWSVWQWYQSAPRADRAAKLARLYPMIKRAADHSAGALDERGLPPASPDYWEVGTDTPNIGTAAPLLSGLNAATDLARRSGNEQDAARWAPAASKLSGAIAKHFAPLGYQRTVDGEHGHDSAAAFMAPPFNRAPADLRPALDTTYSALLRPNGGVVPGDDPAQNWGTTTWTPSTSFFALAWAGIGGEQQKSRSVLDWVLSRRNVLGELPEKVDENGDPGSVVPLAWTASLVVLTLSQLQNRSVGTPPPAG